MDSLEDRKQHFIEKAKEIHGNKYDYSKVIFKNTHTKVLIHCNVCGYDFGQTPHSHLQGHGCPKCGRKNVNKDRRISKDEFLKRAKEIHENKYDYSKMEYVDVKTPVTIICPLHGEFQQKPYNHLLGYGCTKCGIETVRKDKTKDLKHFIEKAKKVHGDKYDYSKTVYYGIAKKLNIICPIHGKFTQLANNHLEGAGCPLCKASKLEEEVRQLLIINNINFEEQKKFKWLGLQSLDFYLPDKNIAIECQGRQHYESSLHFGGIHAFVEQKNRDKKKK